MANHSSSKSSSDKKSKPKHPKPSQAPYNAADAWIQEQSTGGPWDAVDGVNASQWDTPGYCTSQHPDSLVATQGSVKHHKKKDHKSSGKK
ncbi:hypothetical protein PG985_015451 [Apiospora marii]|uniref:Uncharacterized protein n=1 Tax=Apiospora marii TaxID=335849 RepID=A0ABR1S5I9_9PEZI